MQHVTGFATWTERADGAFVAQTERGIFEVHRTASGMIVWHSDASRLHPRVINAAPHQTLGAAFAAAEAHVISAGECGCQHSHPASVPTSPCPPGQANERPALKPGEAPVIYEAAEGFEIIERNPDVFQACISRSRRIGRINNAKEAYKLLAPEMRKLDQETFVVVPLDIHLHMRSCKPVMVALGPRANVSLGLQNVLRVGTNKGAKAIIVAHNHPTGKCQPSKADRDLTKAIEDGCKKVDLTFVDHVIIGLGEFYSIREDKLYRV